MERQQVFETLVFSSTSTRLITQEDFSVLIRHESFKCYKTKLLSPTAIRAFVMPPKQPHEFRILNLYATYEKHVTQIHFSVHLPGFPYNVTPYHVN
jgi:hypothetical protein